jgi:NDP-hexose-3-ketoreductase
MVTLGILGVANIVEKHIIKALSDVKNGTLVGIASRDVAKAKDCALRYNCSYFDSYESLLKSDVDAVYIPLPVGLHEEWVIKAAQAGKHILCEKSLSGDAASVKRMVEACRKNKVLLFEGFMCDCHPQHQKVIESLPAIGDTFLFNGFFGCPPFDKDNIRYSKELAGGSLNDLGAYLVFMSRKILQSEPVSATCILVYGDKEVDVQGTALFEFPGNRFATIGFGFNNVYQNNYSVWGRSGLLRVEPAYSIPADMQPQVTRLVQDGEEKLEVPPANQFTLLFADFFQKIESKAYENFNYAPLIAQARVMEALRISSRENRKVLLSEIP